MEEIGLPDGILVTGGDDTRNHAATWAVRVTMNAQREDSTLLEKLRDTTRPDTSIL